MTQKDKQEAGEGFKFSIGPSEEPPTLLTTDECEVRIEETDDFTRYYRHDRLVLTVRKDETLPLCYLAGPEGNFAIVVVNKPESPAITTHDRPDLDLIIETLPDKSLELTAVDGDPYGFYETFILTSSTVALLDAAEYADRVNELRTLSSAYQLRIQKTDEK